MSLDLNAAKESQFKGTVTSIESMSRRENVGDKVDKFMANMPEKYYPDGLKKFIKDNPDDYEVEVQKYKEGYMDRMGLLFSIEIDEGESFSEWIPTPSRRGYSLSNLKKIIDRNALDTSIKLPEEAEAWVGAEVWCELNDENYYRVSK